MIIHSAQRMKLHTNHPPELQIFFTIPERTMKSVCAYVHILHILVDFEFHMSKTIPELGDQTVGSEIINVLQHYD